MKTLITLIALLTISFSANASFLQSCDLVAKVEAVQNLGTLDGEGYDRLPLVAVARVIKVAQDQGSHTGCNDHVDRIHLVKLEGDQVRRFVEGETFVFNYFFVSSFTPNGVMSSTRYTLIK